VEEKHSVALDFFDPLFVTAFVMAAARDFACLFLLGVAIPVVGQVIALVVLVIVGVVFLFFFFAIRPKLQHFAPKLILVAGAFIPLPLAASLGLFLAIVAQNRLVELVLTQVAIQAVAVGTAGAGEVLEGAALAERGAAVAGELGEVGAGLAEGAGAAEEAAGAGSKLGRLRARAERGLRAHERDLERELGTEETEGERGGVSEEAFGITEPTEKTKELFEPEYNNPQNEETEGDQEIRGRMAFEERKFEEQRERREGETLGVIESAGGKAGIPISRPGENVRGNEEEKDVELKQAA